MNSYGINADHIEKLQKKFMLLHGYKQLAKQQVTP